MCEIGSVENAILRSVSNYGKFTSGGLSLPFNRTSKWLKGNQGYLASSCCSFKPFMLAL